MSESGQDVRWWGTRVEPREGLRAGGRNGRDLGRSEDRNLAAGTNGTKLVLGPVTVQTIESSKLGVPRSSMNLWPARVLLAPHTQVESGAGTCRRTLASHGQTTASPAGVFGHEPFDIETAEAFGQTLG